VSVVDVDLKRKRIALTMRKHGDDEADRAVQRSNRTPPPPARAKPRERSGSMERTKEVPQGAFGAALAEALKRR
jgi:protein Tex